MERLVECVPNISEGRDAALVARILGDIGTWRPGVDHRRRAAEGSSTGHAGSAGQCHSAQRHPPAGQGPTAGNGPFDPNGPPAGRDSAAGNAPPVLNCSLTGQGPAPRVWLLGSEMDTDHNRSVLTIVGEPDAVVEAVVRLAGRAAELIDLNHHRGVHPRIGALDVLPFIPLRGLAMSDCAALAERAGAEIWRRYQVPVYLYGDAARRQSRRRLADVRRGQFEGLRLAVEDDPARRPDIGGPALHPTAGAVAAGARKLMIAYNIQLDTPNVAIARRIARGVRQSGGGLPHVMAMGLLLRSRGLAQVSMNLTDYEVTPPHTVFQLVSREAEAEGVRVLASEIIGLIPQRALDMAAGVDLRWENLTPESILEYRLAAAIP